MGDRKHIAELALSVGALLTLAATIGLSAYFATMVARYITGH